MSLSCYILDASHAVTNGDLRWKEYRLSSDALEGMHDMTVEEREEFYNSPKWRRKSKQILRRDKYQCQLCKRYGRLVEAEIVHHKLELDEYPELALDDDNLVSVCKKCHNKLHPEKGNKTGRYRYPRKNEDRYSGERMA